MPARLQELLDAKHVALDLRAQSAGEAIVEIVDLLRADEAVRAATDFADAVMERESNSSTNTGEGVAFPHARTDLVDQLVLGIGRSAKGVRFGESHPPVKLIFLVGVPRRMVNDYLVCVGAIARLVKNDDIRGALMNAQTAETFIEPLRAGALEL